MSPSTLKLQREQVEVGAALSVGGDDFAIKVVHPADPRFWVRIERDTSGGVVVTDFTQGARSEEELHAGLLRGVEALGDADFSKVTFRDLMPGHDEQAEDRLKYYESGGRARRLATSLAEALGRPILSFSLEPRRNKLDAVARLG